MKTAHRLFVALSLAGSAAAFAAAPALMQEGVLVGTNGMTLYTFDNDAAGSGRSQCNGPCSANWPPLMAEAGAQAADDFTIIQRDDGSRQWAWKGKPLYFWSKDAKPGDRSGDGFRNVWRLAR